MLTVTNSTNCNNNNNFNNKSLVLKVKGLDKPEEQRFTLRSGVLTSIIIRQRSAISCRPLPNAHCLWTRSLQL